MSTSPHYKGGDQIESSIQKVGDTWVIKPTALNVTWGADSRYWSIDKSKDSISLLQVSWLEVTGAFDWEKLGLDKAKTYSLKFQVKMKPDAFGWNGCPVYLMVKNADSKNKNKFTWKKVDLSRLTTGNKEVIPDFFEEKHTFKPPEDDKVVFGLFEIWRGRWKGGLEISKVIIEEEEKVK